MGVIVTSLTLGSMPTRVYAIRPLFLITTALFGANYISSWPYAQESFQGNFVLIFVVLWTGLLEYISSCGDILVAYAAIAVPSLLIALVMMFLTVKHVDALRRDVNQAQRESYADYYADDNDDDDDDDNDDDDDDYVDEQETDVNEGDDTTDDSIEEDEDNHSCHNDNQSPTMAHTGPALFSNSPCMMAFHSSRSSCAPP